MELIIKGQHALGGWENTFSPDVRKRVSFFTYSNKNRPTRSSGPEIERFFRETPVNCILRGIRKNVNY